MTRDELLDLLIAERYAPRSRPTVNDDNELACYRRRTELANAIGDFTMHESTPEQKRADKRRRHLRSVA